MENVKAMEVDLRFATVRFVNPRRIELVGKRGSPLRVEGELKEFPPASGEFGVPLERFIEILGEALFTSVLAIGENRGDDTEMAASQQAASDRTEEADAANQEATENGNGKEAGAEESESAGARESGRSGFARTLVGRPEGTTLRIVSGRSRVPAVRLSVARKEGNEIKERTAGTLTAERALALMDVAGAFLKRTRYMRPLSVAALLCEDGKVTFISGTRESGLTDWQQRELKYVLSRRFLGDDRPIRFRVGRFSLVEEDGRIFFRFGRVRQEITPADVAVIRAVLL